MFSRKSLRPLNWQHLENDCFERDGFDLWRQCFIGQGHNNTECCRPKGKDDAMPEQCVNLCDFESDIGDVTASAYAICEEFRYRINCCNAISEKSVCGKL